MGGPQGTGLCRKLENVAAAAPVPPYLQAQRGDVAVAALSRRQIEEFHHRGYTIQPGVLRPGEVAELQAAFDRLARRARALGASGEDGGARFVLEPDPHQPGGVRIQRIVWCGAAEPVLAHYGRDVRLLAMAAQLLGSRRMSQLINQAHFKLPGDGVSFPWHQDSTHRRHGTGLWRDVNGRGSYVQTVIALDDAGADSGPLMFLPGSNAHGHLDLPADGTLPPFLAPIAPEEALLEAGGVLLFGPYVVHASRPNRSAHARRTLLNGYASPGANARIYPGRGTGRLLRV